MIRAALALARGDRRGRAPNARSPGRGTLDRHYANPVERRLLPHRRRCRGTGGAVRAPRPTTPRRIRTGSRGGNLVRLAVLTGQQGLARAGRPPVRGRAGCGGRQPVRAPCFAQRARPAAARRRDRRDRNGRGCRPIAGRPPAVCRSSTASCCARSSAAALSPAHPAQAKLHATKDAGRLRVRR